MDGEGDSLIRVIVSFAAPKLQFSIPTRPRAEFFSQAVVFSSRKIAQVRLGAFPLTPGYFCVGSAKTRPSSPRMMASSKGSRRSRQVADRRASMNEAEAEAEAGESARGTRIPPSHKPKARGWIAFLSVHSR
jgi:hypothetical protein